MRSITYILIFTLSVSLASAMTAISPLDGIQETQPLFSWTDHPDSPDYYLLFISSTSDFQNPEYNYQAASPYYQMQVELPAQVWYWKVQAFDANDALLEESEVFEFSTMAAPDFKITVDTSQYEDDKQVDFIIDAPLGSEVDMLIQKDDFVLPFTTTDLQTTTFSTFLDPGTYEYSADFNYMGFEGSYVGTLTLEESLPTIFNVTFNITNGTSPIEGADISLDHDDRDYSGVSDVNGSLTLTIESGTYSVVVLKEGYELETWSQQFDQEEELTVTLTPEVPDAEVAALEADTSGEPVITITSPASDALLTDSFTVSFTVTSHSSVSSCDLQTQLSDQQGWLIASSTDAVVEQNTLSVDEPSSGATELRIKCLVGETTYYSTPVPVNVQYQIPKEQLVRGFVSLIDEAQTKNTGDNLILNTLNLQGDYDAAKADLDNLQQEYELLIDEQGLDAADSQKQKILAVMNTYNQTLVQSVNFIDEQDKVTIYQPTVDSPAIDFYVELFFEGSTKAKPFIEEKQDLYSTRTSIATVEIVYFDGSKKFLTGLTRSIQSFSDEPFTDPLVILDYLPSEVLQHIGQPEILSDAGVEFSDDYVLLTAPLAPYTFLFSGNVDVSSIIEHSPVIVEPFSESDLPEDPSIISTITGFSAFAVGDTSTPFFVIIWVVVVGLLIAGIFKNPVYNYGDWLGKRQVAKFTDHVHDALDQLKHNNYQRAFTKYPKILSLYNELSYADKQKLSFSVQLLHDSLDEYSFMGSLQDATTKLHGLSSAYQLAELHQVTQALLQQYESLSDSSKQKFRPQLLDFSYQLRQREQYFNY